MENAKEVEEERKKSIERYNAMYVYKYTVVSSQSNKIPEALTSAFQLAAPQE